MEFFDGLSYATILGTFKHQSHQLAFQFVDGRDI